MFTFSGEWFDAILVSIWWPWVRIVALMATEPFWSNRTIPRRVKVLFSLCLALIIAPLLPPMPVVPLFSATGLLVTVNQILIGLAIGFSVRLVFVALEMAGHLIGLQMGLGFAAFFDPQHSQPVPVMAMVTGLLGILLYLSFDGHLVTISALVDSFRAMPVTITPLAGRGFARLYELGGMMFLYGVWLSLPAIAALMVANLAVGVMARAAPQFNLFAVGFPIMLALGLLAFYVTLPQLANQFNTALGAAIQGLAETQRLLAGGH